MALTSSMAAKRLGVSVKTLQRWDRDGLFKPSSRTRTNRRVYAECDLDAFQQIDQKSLTKQQTEEEVKIWRDAINTDYQPRFKFTRATLVLDNGLGFLKDALLKKRFSVLPRRDKSDVDLMESALVHRVLVTNRYKRYFYEAPVKEFSLIDIAEAGKDATGVSARISNAFVDHELMQKQPFLLQLKANGKDEVHLIF